ncbi:RHS repeat domain-containing protein [Pseudomonas fitomaticsae]
MNMVANAHFHTPTVEVFDPRGLVIRNIGFYRCDPDEMVQSRISRQVFDQSARLIANWDPRLWALVEQGHDVLPNDRVTFTLNSLPILTRSVDEGQRLTLVGDAAQALDVWDSRGSQFHRVYDDQLRVLELHERTLNEPFGCIERLRYAGNEIEPAYNLRGRLLRHDDAGGSRSWEGYDLHSQPLREVQRFLKTMNVPDWPENEPEREALLESSSYKTKWVRNAEGKTINFVDAKGNDVSRVFNICGQATEVWLTLAGTSKPHCLASSMVYNAQGNVVSQTSGKGILISTEFDPLTGYLRQSQVRKSSGQLLQDLRYSYDAVGNVVKKEDRAQSVQYFKNQIIEPIAIYKYDTLYRLISASGKESILATGGADLPELAPIGDASRQRNYLDTFVYDAANNLLELHHQAGEGSYKKKMKVAERTNRSLYWQEGEDDSDPDSGFDLNGNQKNLLKGQELDWDSRNQLVRASQVVRAEGVNDEEFYQYDSSSSRLRKLSVKKAKSLVSTSVVSYLPGLEIRENLVAGEQLQVVCVELEGGTVQILHWDSGPPEGLLNDSFRFGFSDQLGSVLLELSEDARLISQEEYHSFGTTAWWASGSAVEAKYKTIRYSGKQRDSTGLYYYRYRYYAPWLFRWLSADPAPTAEEVNRYCMVGNNPVSYIDSHGLNRLKTSEMDQIVPADERLHVARGMINEISQYEPAVTSLLDQVSAELGAALYGREYRLKTAESLAQKLSVAPPNQMNDVLRYTIGFPYGEQGDISEQEQQDFLQGVVRSFYVLGSSGYKPALIRNTFSSGQAYKGINANFLLPDGKTKFEIQVHTSQSYKIKSEGHVRYEAIRSLDRELASGAVSKDRREAVEAELSSRRIAHTEASAAISTPVGIQEWVPSTPEMKGFKWQTHRLTSEQRRFYSERVKTNMRILTRTSQNNSTIVRRNSM